MSDEKSRFSPGDLLTLNLCVLGGDIDVLYLKTTQGYVRLVGNAMYGGQFQNKSIADIANSENALVKLGNLLEPFNNIMDTINKDIKSYVHT